MKKPVRLTHRVIYRHNWLNLYVDKVRFPGGRLVDHHMIDFHRQSAGAVVEDARGRILFVRSYRYVTGSLNWEIPAGVLEKGESVLAGARREVWEETGYETTGHRKIYTFNPVPGVANKVFHVVCCRATQRTGTFDRNEVQSVRWFSKPAVRNLILHNKIMDGFSLVALLFRLGKAIPGRRR